MRSVVVIACGVLGTCLMSAPAFAGFSDAITVPEPVSLTLLAGGIASIAAVKRYRRK